MDKNSLTMRVIMWLFHLHVCVFVGEDDVL